MKQVIITCDICNKTDEENKIKEVVIPIKFKDKHNIGHIDYETPHICYECCKFIINHSKTFDSFEEYSDFIYKFGFTEDYKNSFKLRYKEIL